MAFLLVLGAQSLGVASARGQEDFYVVPSMPNLALVKAYGDLMIAIKFDPISKAATGEVMLFKLDDSRKQLSITKKRIGPLRGTELLFLNVK